MTTGSILKHVRDLALPSSIGLFFHTMYNVVDSAYAGGISKTALAALALSFPVYLLVIAASSGLSRGATALIANAIGSQDVPGQRRYVAQSISLGLLISVGLTVVGLVVARPLFRLLGAEGNYLAATLSYINPIFFGSIFFVIINLSNAILIASGDSKTFGKVLVVGFFLNLILDPWFLHGGWGVPAMGIAGIAWATVIIQMLGSVWLIATVMRRGLLDLRPLKYLRPDFSVYREIAQQALPASFNVMSVALGFFVVNYFLKPYGQATVAAFGVTTRIEQIGLLPTFGLYAAIMALVGQNNGARNFDRIGETMRVCNRLGLAINVAMSLLIFGCSWPLLRIFTDDEEVIHVGVNCLKIIMPIQWSYVMTSTHLAMLQAIKRPTYGFFESVLRKVLLPWPLLWLFVSVYGYPIDWVWYTVAGTNVLLTIVTVVYAQSVLRRLTEPPQ